MTRKTRLRLIAALLAIITLLVAGGVWELFYKKIPLPARRRTFIVPKSQTVAALLPKLAQRGIVRRPRILLFVARRQGVEAHTVNEGGYIFPPQVNVWDVLKKLTQREPDLFKVTIPPGLMARQVARRLSNARTVVGAVRITDEAEFLRLCHRPTAMKALPDWAPRDSLEGFLFPDTYYFARHQPAERVITAMLRTFESVVLAPRREDFARAPIVNGKRMTLKEVITLASLIQREVVRPEERAMVASVYINRLRAGQRLECDATVQYAKGSWKPPTARDLRTVESPYNTYKHRGLPPTPIANPDLSNILAALQPKRTEYFYYVARGDGSNGHYFSRTYEGHLRNVERYRQNRRRRSK
ncbi:MAG: endolytic transglycosylase MltG [Abditibacteriales bacterium]|nr:endolytic transglycosylase MltG [Abditibacteriales bacterium]MDW8366875.1 endolytic transglycosylase MltG [Abditibacteriales bacterium]